MFLSEIFVIQSVLNLMSTAQGAEVHCDYC